MKNLKRFMGIIAAVASLSLLAGCSFHYKTPFINIAGHGYYSYADAQQYTVGIGEETAEGVKSLDVNWINGKVELSSYDGDTVKFSETVDSGKSSGGAAMRWWLDNGVLRIRFCESGYEEAGKLSKTLTVMLPKELASSVGVYTTSADVQAQDIKARDISVDTTSGEILLSNCSAKKDISADSTSGDITLTDCSAGDDISADSTSGEIYMESCRAAETIEADSTSGDIEISLEDAARDIEIDTTSGKVRVSAVRVNSFKVDTTSGAVELSFSAAPPKGEIDTVSGRVTLKLPDMKGFTLDFETVSGKLESDFHVKTNGDHEYVYGNGECCYDVETVSGSLYIIEN